MEKTAYATNDNSGGNVMTDLLTFWHVLDSHDWYASMSDSNAIYKSGEDKKAVLLAVAKESDRHRELYNAFNAYMWHIGGEVSKPPKPPTPLERCPICINWGPRLPGFGCGSPDGSRPAPIRWTRPLCPSCGDTKWATALWFWGC